VNRRRRICAEDAGGRHPEFRFDSKQPCRVRRDERATTTVVTKSGGNEFHGNLYEFQNESSMAGISWQQPCALKQNQFGGTFEDRSAKQDFLFLFYEGFRNREGVTRHVPSDAQRNGISLACAIRRPASRCR
jgi:hypothetical protein